MGNASPATDLNGIAWRVVAAGVAPAAAVGAARFDAGWRTRLGCAGALWPEGVAPDAPPSATPGTVFDLASLTKPVVALLLARLERRGVLSREESLAAVLAGVLPEIGRTASAGVSLDSLLAHRAGLVAHNPFYEGVVRGERPSLEAVLVGAADMRRADCSGPVPDEGFAPVYSDLGYLLVGAAIEARAGAPLADLVDDEVVPALGLDAPDVLGSVERLVVAGVPRERFAPTEVVAWRGGLVHALVHDENAWLVAGEGMAGHAGLFGTVGAVVAFGRLVLDVGAGRSTWLSPTELAPLTRARAGGSLAAGFDRRSTDPCVTPSSGSRFGADTYGHLGFTGTSLWVDPATSLVGVLLTNRVCPTREHIAIRRARPEVYDALYGAMLEDD